MGAARGRGCPGPAPLRPGAPERRRGKALRKLLMKSPAVSILVGFFAVLQTLESVPLGMGEGAEGSGATRAVLDIELFHILENQRRL